jgi:hypothetical protein
MTPAKETKTITVRVSEEEKLYLEKIAEAHEMTMSELVRDQMKHLYLARERGILLKQLKANTKEKDDLNRGTQRAELLRSTMLNISTSLNWFRNKVKHSQREINRLESTQKNYQKFEQKMQEELAE